MKLKNDRSIHRYVKDSYGPKGFVFWIQDCYFPTFYFVRGESLEDAYEWFLCDPTVENQLKVENDEWLIKDLNGKTIEQAVEDGTLTFNDNRVMMWSENDVHGTEVDKWFHSERW